MRDIMKKPPLITAGLIMITVAILSIGIGKDFRLRHEDNGALYATIAKSHLYLGITVTKAHDVLYNKKSGSIWFYGHHPPGIGLILAAVFKVTGKEEPFIIRMVVIFFHLISFLLLYRLLRQLLSEREALAGALLFAILPQSAFFGRMYNHEPMVLPAVILLVERYRAYRLEGGRMAVAGLILSAIWGALTAWAAFFAIGACAAHAFWGLLRRETRAARTFWMLIFIGAGLFAFDLAHIFWVMGGSLKELGQTFMNRPGMGSSVSAYRWIGYMVDVHRRYFTITGFVAICYLSLRIILGTIKVIASKQNRVKKEVPVFGATTLFGIFLLAGVAYMIVFNAWALKHHYWQFLLIPADILAILLLWRRLLSWRSKWRNGPGVHPRIPVPSLIIVLILLEIVASCTVTLVIRHTRPEPYCINTVKMLRSNHF